MRFIPPTLTLFPYTTLFRSVDSVDQSLQQLRKAIHTPLADNRAFIHIIFHARVEQLVTLLSGKRTSCSTRAWKIIDRKSTRLNSSHVEVSYAVFCLKKKKAG